MSDLCSRCKRLLTGHSGLRYMGAFVAHAEGDCERILLSELERLESELAEAIECCTIKDNRNLRLEAQLSALGRELAEAKAKVAEAADWFGDSAARMDEMRRELASAQRALDWAEVEIEQLAQANDALNAQCKTCNGTGSIDAPTSEVDPSCPDCDGEGTACPT